MICLVNVYSFGSGIWLTFVDVETRESLIFFEMKFIAKDKQYNGWSVGFLIRSWEREGD